MRTTLTPKESTALDYAGFRINNKPIGTLDHLLFLMPKVIECYRYRPEQRWEDMSDPTYGINLVIEADTDIDDNGNEIDVWNVYYSEGEWKSPDLSLKARDPELIVALFKVALAYAYAPDVWIKKGVKK